MSRTNKPKVPGRGGITLLRIRGHALQRLARYWPERMEVLDVDIRVR